MDDLDLISVDYEEDGVLLRKQIDKYILAKGAWPIILFLYQEYDKSIDDYKPPKAMIIKYRKLKGTYRKHSSINITNAKHALKISEILEQWFKNEN